MTGFSGGKFDQLKPEPPDPPNIGAVCHCAPGGIPSLVTGDRRT